LLEVIVGTFPQFHSSQHNPDIYRALVCYYHGVQYIHTTLCGQPRRERHFYFLNHPVGWQVLGFMLPSLISSIFLLYSAIPRHLIFSAVMLGVILRGYFALLYLIIEVHPARSYVSGITSIEDAYYFSITTYTTIGYGDFTPTEWCRALTSFQALLGLFTIGVFPALIISELRRSETREISS
jgi:hypothetical protein